MNKYYLYSTLLHASFLALVFSFSFFRPQSNILWLDGDGFSVGPIGGGGDGKARKGRLKKLKRGQAVPKPQNIPVPEKPQPVQKATQAKKAWKVDDPKIKKPVAPVKRKEIDSSIPTGEKTQKATSNIIRRGVEKGTTAGVENYDFGDGEEGDGLGKGVGIQGIGPGSGFGYGSYLGIVRKRIFSEWIQYQLFGTDKSCVVGLTIDRSGQVSRIRVVTSSQDPSFDQIARRAVRNASPMPPLPPGFPKSEQRFRIKFQLLE